MIRTFRPRGPVVAAIALALTGSLIGCGSDSNDADSRPATDLEEVPGPVDGGTVVDGTDGDALQQDDDALPGDAGDLVTDPEPAAPASVDPVPTNPEPTDPVPTDPGPADPPVTAVPTFTPSFETFDVARTVPEDAAALEGLRTPLPVRLSGDGSRLLVRASATDLEDRLTYRFLSYDVAADRLDPLSFAPTADAFPAFDADWNTIASADGCDLRVQRRDRQSEPVSLGGGALDGSCVSMQSVQLSDDGDTVLVEAFDRERGASRWLVVGIASGSVIDLAGTALRVDAPELAGLEQPGAVTAPVRGRSIRRGGARVERRCPGTGHDRRLRRRQRARRHVERRGTRDRAARLPPLRL